MVRVGGGWDTLQNYLDKHDPCRCRRGIEISQLSLTFKIPFNISQGTGQLLVPTCQSELAKARWQWA